MAGTVVDYSDVADFQAVPAGDYAVTLTAKKWNDAKEYWALTFTIQDEDYPDLNGRKLFRNYSLKSKEAMPFFKQFAVAAGADPEAFAGSVDTEEILDSIMGNPCVAVVEEREYNGEMRASVKRVKATDF